MVRFAQKFEANQIDEWSEKYVNFIGLCVLLNEGGRNASRSTTSFTKGLTEEEPMKRHILAWLMQSSSLTTVDDDDESGSHVSRDLAFRRKLAAEIEKADNFYLNKVRRYNAEIDLLQVQAAATR